LSVWEGVEPAGMTGGNLRREFAAGLTQAAALLDEPRLGDETARWVEIAELWHTLAEAAVPTSVPACARARELTAEVTGAVAEGDAGRADRAAAARCRGDHRDPRHHERDPQGDLRRRARGGPTARYSPGCQCSLNQAVACHAASTVRYPAQAGRHAGESVNPGRVSQPELENGRTEGPTSDESAHGYHSSHLLRQ
jgi:hypothetical protein